MYAEFRVVKSPCIMQPHGTPGVYNRTCTRFTRHSPTTHMTRGNAAGCERWRWSLTTTGATGSTVCFGRPGVSWSASSWRSARSSSGRTSPLGMTTTTGAEPLWALSICNTDDRKSLYTSVGLRSPLTLNTIKKLITRTVHLRNYFLLRNHTNLS